MHGSQNINTNGRMKRFIFIQRKYYFFILLSYMIAFIYSWIYEECRITQLEHSIEQYKIILSLPDSVTGTCMHCKTPYVQYLYPDSSFTKHHPQ